jgi:hypothetical protein
MSEVPGSRLERFLESTARRVSGGKLHPLEILERVQGAVEASARGGVVANDILVEFHPHDYDRYEPSLPRLRQEIAGLLDDFESSRGLRHMSRRRIDFVASQDAAEALPVIAARFADTSRPAAEAVVDHAPTRRITRHRNVDVVMDDGNRVPLTHTPFSIGRGPGNDLVLPSFAVSRRHADILRSSDGFVVRDAGSRNGILVDGRRVREVALEPRDGPTIGDIAVTIGDVTLWLERAE